MKYLVTSCCDKFDESQLTILVPPCISCGKSLRLTPLDDTPHDMPKLHSPFVRENGVVTPNIEPGYEWVFEDPNVAAVEKLDGTNVSIVMQSGDLTGLYNRTNRKPVGILDCHIYIEGVRNWIQRGHHLPNYGQHFGELMGPKIQKNFLKLEKPLWIPFEYLKEKASYKSFHKYPKTFENLSKWFQNDLFSLVYQRWHGDKVQPEGIVFHHPDGRMAKLRVDMFEWYKGKRHGE